MLSIFKKWFGSSAPDMGQLLAGGAVVLDVRTKNEYDAGHINGAKHIPLDKLQGQLDQVRKLNKPVITVCRSGSRSAMAKNILNNAGIEAYNGGAWTSLKNTYALK